jgi:ribonuclease P/MRP protein subunit RPP40
MENESSTLLEILLGVPQGSILAPLLFLIYINCLPLATNLLTMLYADDTTFFNEAESIDDLYSKTNSMLSEAEQWFLANRPTLHPAKTRYMLFSYCKTNLTLQLMGHNILRIQESGPEKSFKLVGVHLDEQMNWKHHVTHVKQKMAGAMSLVCRAKHFLPRKIRILL